MVEILVVNFEGVLEVRSPLLNNKLPLCLLVSKLLCQHLYPNQCEELLFTASLHLFICLNSLESFIGAFREEGIEFVVPEPFGILREGNCFVVKSDESEVLFVLVFYSHLFILLPILCGRNHFVFPEENIRTLLIRQVLLHFIN